MGNARILHPSPVESKRFGLDIARGTIGPNATPDSILDDILALRPDVAIFRCAAGDTGQLAALAGAGLVPLHADTLVYYQAALAARAGVGNTIAPAVRRSGPGDEEALAHLVRRSFAGYRNHYHANPWFQPAAILEGYVEWALAYATSPAPQKETWVRCENDEVRGFATCRIDATGSTVEIVLNAVDPDWQGRGLYSELLDFLLAHYARSGMTELSVSTQVWNYRVQRAWARAGLAIDRAYDTYHVNVPKNFQPGR